MKNKSGLIIVVLCLLAAVGLVWTMSNSSSNPQASASTPTQKTDSPDLTKINGYDFLDLVPAGHAAPDFKATTAEGKPVSLKDFKGKKNVVMIFYQGSFCPHCAAQLSNVQKHLTDFQKQDAEVLAISADDKQHAMQSVGENGLSYKVIPDTDRKIIKEYGVPNMGKGGIAWPAVYVIDKQGKVRLSFADEHGKRLHSNEILPALSKITGKPSPRLGYDE